VPDSVTTQAPDPGKPLFTIFAAMAETERENRAVQGEAWMHGPQITAGYPDRR
jgi:hypothetical protein